MAPESWTLEPPIRVEEGSTLCGRYQVAHMIGSGGMAAVYAGTHRNGHRVAIKMLHARLSMNPETDRRFRREAQLANQVNHPGAVPVIDDDVTEDGRSFLVMPLLEGETVRSWTDRRGGRLAIGEAISIVCAALDVLAAAHAGGVVHCDIKPENVFLMRDGTVRVLDFGIARFFAASSPSATRTGMAVGTPAFMAPEQALGRFREISAQTDVWAAGATLFTLLSGEFVHTGETGEELMAHAATKPARSIADVAPDAPTEVRDIVDRALAFRRTERWQSAAAMRIALLAVADSVSDIRCQVVARDAASGRGSVHSVATHSPDLVVALGANGAAPLEMREAALTLPGAATSVPVRRPIAGRWKPRLLTASFAAMAASAIAGASWLHFNQARDQAVHADWDKESSKPEARAALESGLQLWKDASSQAARDKFAEAARSDPGLGSAHALLVAASEWVDPDIRSHFLEAQALRAHLSKSQAELLESLEPLMSEPPDYDGATKRLASLTDRYPKDDIAWIARATHGLRIKNPANTLALLPHLHGAIALWLRARAELLQGDAAAGRSSLQSCTEAAAHAVDCLVLLARLEANEGECAAASTVAKRLIAVDHESPHGYDLLARAELGLTHRTSAARAILEGKWSHQPANMRDIGRARDEFFLAVYDGRFDDADASYDAWQTAASKSADAATRTIPFLSRIALDLELGRDDSAREAARAFSDGSIGWVRSDYMDMGIEVTRELYMTGLIDRPAFLSRRAQDEQALIARGGYFATTGIRWFDAYVQIVRVREDAALALEHAPSDRQVAEATLRDVGVDTKLGRMYLLVDRVDDALVHLRRATRSCSIYKSIDYVQAFALYGQALAKVGRTREACDALSSVLTHWGRASSRSQTVRAAEESSRHLGCSTTM